MGSQNNSSKRRQTVFSRPLFLLHIEAVLLASIAWVKPDTQDPRISLRAQQTLRLNQHVLYDRRSTGRTEIN